MIKEGAIEKTEEPMDTILRAYRVNTKIDNAWEELVVKMNTLPDYMRRLLNRLLVLDPEKRAGIDEILEIASEWAANHGSEL